MILKSFSMKFPKVLRTIRQNIFKELSTILLGLGVMIKKDFLKYNGQYSMPMQVLTITTMLRRHLLSSIMTFMCFYEIWSSSGENKLLYLLMVFLNSFLEKCSHYIVGFNRVLSNRLGFIWWFCTELNIWYKVCYKLLSFM